MQGRLGEKELIIGKQNTVVKNYAILVPLVSFLYYFCKVMNDYVSTKKKKDRWRINRGQCASYLYLSLGGFDA